MALATPGLVATVGTIAGRAGRRQRDCRTRDRCRSTCGTPTIGMRKAAVERLAQSGRGDRVAARTEGDAGSRGSIRARSPWMPRWSRRCSIARVERTGAPVHRMTSGAGHDAMIVAARMPAGMLFLRSAGASAIIPTNPSARTMWRRRSTPASRFLDELERAACVIMADAVVRGGTVVTPDGADGRTLRSRTDASSEIAPGLTGARPTRSTRAAFTCCPA